MAMSDDGLVTIASTHNFKDTVDRIEADVKSKNLTMFARVDHAASEKEVGMPRRLSRPRRDRCCRMVDATEPRRREIVARFPACPERHGRDVL
jgi:hypothetical protein